MEKRIDSIGKSNRYNNMDNDDLPTAHPNVKVVRVSGKKQPETDTKTRRKNEPMPRSDDEEGGPKQYHKEGGREGDSNNKNKRGAT